MANSIVGIGMRASIIAAAALVVLGLFLTLDAFRNPLTFYSMFDFGVFTLIVGVFLPFCSRVEKVLGEEFKGSSPVLPRPIMATDEETKTV